MIFRKHGVPSTRVEDVTASAHAASAAVGPPSRPTGRGCRSRLGPAGSTSWVAEVVVSSPHARSPAAADRPSTRARWRRFYESKVTAPRFLANEDGFQIV